MKKTKKLVSILLIFIMAASVFCINSYAADNGIKVKFKVGSTSVQIDGTYKSFEKSYISNGTVMASSDILVKALGAELNNNGKGNYNIVYRNESIDMTAGSKKCDINQTEGTLPAAPAVKGTSLMVPFKYTAEKLGATVRYDSSTGTLTADWADDGALTDLSFLTDSIKKTRVGDSFYGWNMNIPRGSRVAYSSFNSRHISIENTNRSVYFDIYIDKPGKDITNIEDYYNQVMDSPEDYLNGSVPDDSNLVTTGTVPYAEFRYTGSSGEPIIQRSYMNSGSIYSVMLSYYSDNGTDDISDSPYYKAILDSFSFGYKGTNIDVQDLSKITYGMAEYSNYSTFENGNKYYSWQVSVPSDWDYIKSPAESPLSTKLGTGSDQYINIEIEKPIGSNNVETIGSSLKNLYNSNYSPSLYKFEQGEVTSTAAGKAYHMLYDLSLGGTFYSYDEYLLVSGGLLYDLTLKCPQTSYQQKKDENKKILSSFKPADKVSAAYSKDIDSYQNQTNRNRVG
ncbi:MAG: stalk domain-containing protein, partial [Bacillota bacterium]|nr:stalk domain-containing protein [Bacillota bacterium]